MNEGWLQCHTLQSLGGEVPSPHFTGEKAEAAGGLAKLSRLVTALLPHPKAHPAAHPVFSQFIQNPATAPPRHCRLSPTRAQKPPWSRSASAPRSLSRHWPEGPSKTVSPMCPFFAQTLWTRRPLRRPPWPPAVDSSAPPALRPRFPLSVAFLPLGPSDLVVATSPPPPERELLDGSVCLRHAHGEPLAPRRRSALFAE